MKVLATTEVPQGFSYLLTILMIAVNSILWKVYTNKKYIFWVLDKLRSVAVFKLYFITSIEMWKIDLGRVQFQITRRVCNVYF